MQYHKISVEFIHTYFFEVVFINKEIKYIIVMLYLGIMSAIITNFLYHINENTIKNRQKEFINENYVNDKMFSDFKYFPVALINSSDTYFVFENSYGDKREYGGDRVHEGIDIMSSSNLRGELPVISVCDGIVENIGWLELGGYRVGIRSENGVYYYYAHLYAYDDNIKMGEKVYAGQILGYMGDTGYSKVEGTVGNFAVHLHFGIYINTDGVERTINPYEILKKYEKSILIYDF